MKFKKLSSGVIVRCDGVNHFYSSGALPGPCFCKTIPDETRWKEAITVNQSRDLLDLEWNNQTSGGK